MRHTAKPMIVEFLGVPGGGKSTAIRTYNEAYPEEVALATIDMYRRLPVVCWALMFILLHPLASLRLGAFVSKHHARGLFWFSLHLLLRAVAKYQKASCSKGTVFIDEGVVHVLCVLPGKPVSEAKFSQILAGIPLPDGACIALSGTFHRFHRKDGPMHPRATQDPAALAAWEDAVRKNVIAMRHALRAHDLSVYELPEKGVGDTAPFIRTYLSQLSSTIGGVSKAARTSIILGTFVLVALLGVLLSLSAPYIKSTDEQVYLLGALEAHDGDLPDAYMLQGYAYGPYLHPKILFALSESMGEETFKSFYLFVLVIATGLAAYFLFRSLLLPWVPSLLLSVITLMPRTAAGTEFFGVFTFHEAIGRSAAVPLVLLASAFILRRMREGRALWPVFALLGLFLFLHPVTVTLFAFVALTTIWVTRLFMRTPFMKATGEAVLGGLAYLALGSYFFVDVFSKLSNNVADAGVSSAAYVGAILFRNAWEFPAATLAWYRHMGVVSAIFLIALLAAYLLPQLRTLRKKYPFPHARLVTLWGVSMMVLALVFAILIPGANLYLMQHADAPYAFQQWSRISKFFYLGLFVSIVPLVGSLWMAYRSATYRFKHLVLAVLVLAGVASSSLGFEVAQFVVGHKDYTAAYIPQALSGIKDGVTPQQYRETCVALTELGATSADEVMSNDFGLRYYCKANLYVTQEEGAAYTYLLRSDLVWWHEAFLAQRAAFNTGDPQQIFTFARGIGAHYVVLPRTEKYAAFEMHPGEDTRLTTAHIIVRLPQ